MQVNVVYKYKELRAIKINKLIDSEIFYGTTMNIMNITGHSKESTFLTYLGRIKIKMHWQICLCNKRGLFGDFTFLFLTFFYRKLKKSIY